MEHITNTRQATIPPDRTNSPKEKKINDQNTKLVKYNVLLLLLLAPFVLTIITTCSPCRVTMIVKDSMTAFGEIFLGNKSYNCKNVKKDAIYNRP